MYEHLNALHLADHNACLQLALHEPHTREVGEDEENEEGDVE